MKDLILYGNLVQDTIHIYDEEFKMGQPNNNGRIIKSLGGIGNHVSTIELTELKLDYSVESMLGSEYNPLSSAFVVIDKKDGKRRKTSCVKWGHDTKLSGEYIKTEPAQWKHISYIDALPNLTAKDVWNMSTKEGNEAISVDLCGASFDYDEEILDIVDFIITSDTELHKLNPRHRFKSIIHSPTGTIYWENEEMRHIKNPITLDDDICILGAGDAYCVSFIAHYLKTYSMEESIRFAHENAYKFLVKKYKL